MRALCIDGNFSRSQHRKDWPFLKHVPVEGKVYEVEVVGQNFGYVLTDVDAGVSPFTGKPFTFFSNRFVPLQDEEEEECMNTTEEELCSTR